MDFIYKRVAGIDVHKKTVVVCVLVIDEQGELRKEVRTFETMTRDLLALCDWLADWRIERVAMESTGVYWKPVLNLLEDRFQVMLVNAQHVKQVPGRKTDVKDCEWIAQLLQCGLLRASFVPARPQRELRDLTRQRAKLIQEKATASNRIQKTLEDANIKLASVASDVLGVSGREMLRGLIEQVTDSVTLADKAKRKMRAKIPQLQRALEGHVTDHHRFMLKSLLKQVEFLEGQIVEFDERIEALLHPFLQAQDPEALTRLKKIPGLGLKTAQCLIAEIGLNMAQFPSAAHLASWAGMCPGNNESAGKRRSGKTAKGCRWLRRTLGEAAWAAARSKDSYLAAQFHRLGAKRGKKRAIVAVGHCILVIAYTILRDKAEYAELGADHFLHMNSDRLTRHYIKKLNALGHEVTLAPRQQAA